MSSMARSLPLNLLLFFGLAAPLSFYLSGIDRYPDHLRSKLEYYGTHSDEFDSLIVGSSYAFSGIDPFEFDAAMQEQGIESSTFNLAINGLLGHAIDEALRLALKADTDGRLKRVYIDLRPLEVGMHPLFAGTEYETWWHSFGQTRAVLGTVWKSRESFIRKISFSKYHLALLIENHLPLGTARSLLSEKQEEADHGWFDRLVSEYRGFESLDPDRVYNPVGEDDSDISWIMLDQRGRMLEDPPGLKRAEQKLIEDAAGPGDLRGQNVEFWRKQSSLLRSHDVVGVHIIMPAFSNPLTSAGKAIAREGAFDSFISFNDPAVFPEFFDINNRFEYGHLNRDGAALFSRRLGSEMAAYLLDNPSRIERISELAPL